MHFFLKYDRHKTFITSHFNFKIIAYVLKSVLLGNGISITPNNSILVF